MKIDLQSIDRGNFEVQDRILNGEMFTLVGPRREGTTWTQKNKIFRSSLWNNNGELVSAGFPKFVNWGESIQEFPVPADLKGATIVEKIDGSLLIVSKYKGNYILRTRGTVDATELDNGHELEIFKQTILPKLENENGISNSWNYSFLFEWVSPTQQIVIKYDQPQWYLVGMVFHDNYELQVQIQLDYWAKKLNVPRPATYTFTSIPDLLDNVEIWEGKEGVVVYSGCHEQVLHKVKSFWYLVKHRFKSQATLENTVDLYFQLDMPSYQNFEKEISAKFDYECFDMVKGYASRICDSKKIVDTILGGISNFIKPLKSIPRREAAEKILSSYGQTGRSNLCFTLLNSKLPSKDQLKKLYWQVLKKS